MTTAAPATLTDQQQAIVEDLVTTTRPITRYHGYAGVGKTHTLRVAAETIRATGRTAQALAPTGKAALRLRQKGVTGADTIHSWLYQPGHAESRKWRDSWNRLPHTKWGDAARTIDAAANDTDLAAAWEKLIAQAPSKHVARLKGLRDARRWVLVFTAAGAIDHYETTGTPAADVLIIDEASMVSASVAADLARTGSQLIYVGDPAQLPPVGAAPSRDAMGEPHHLLKKVLRQHEGSQIASLARAVRRRDVLTPPHTPRRELRPIDEYDVVLCWRNATRDQVTRLARLARGHDLTDLPQPGEWLINLRNTDRDIEPRWMNGERMQVIELVGQPAPDRVTMAVRTEMGQKHLVTADATPLAGAAREREHLDGMRSTPSGPVVAYGYGVTVHKSQGSEWDRVLLVDETPTMMRMHESRQGRDAAEREVSRWLYTGCTRASRELHVVGSLHDLPR